MRSETVTSAKNPKINELLALQEKSSLRRETGLFVVEGRRELEHCLEAGYEIDTVFYCPELTGGEGRPLREFALRAHPTIPSGRSPRYRTAGVTSLRG